jgi:hypothetical protein
LPFSRAKSSFTFREPLFPGDGRQGDRMGRIFAHSVGDCLLWAVFLKIKELAHIFALPFSTDRDLH